MGETSADDLTASRRQHCRDRWGLLALFVFALLVRLYFASSPFLHPWDERFHAVVAKNMMSEPFKPMLYRDPVHVVDMTAWSENHVWLHKPPLALWLMAASMHLFGVNELALRFPSMLAGALSVLLTFSLARRLFKTDLRIAWVAALLHACNGFVIEVGSGWMHTDHPDALLTCAVELGVWFAVRLADEGRWQDAVGLGTASGLAVLTKWLPGLLPLGVCLVLLWQRKRSLLWLPLGAAVAVTIFLPWTVYTQHAFPEEAAHERAYNWMHMWIAAENHVGGFFFHLQRVPQFFGELAPLAIAWCVLKPRQYLALLAWFSVPYVFFSLVATKMPAYVMPAAPAIFLLIASCAVAFWEKRRWWLAVPLVLLPLRLPIERALRHDASPAQWTRELRALHFDGPTVLFNVAHPIEAMFYTPHQAYAGQPSPAQLEQAQAKGYRVVVLPSQP